MKRYGLLAVAVLTLLGMLAPPAFAQEMPKPKVTISGFIDGATSWAKNVRDDSDATTDEEFWYSRHRGRFDIDAEIGKAKAVFGFEMDFTNGKAVGGQKLGEPDGTPGGFGDCGFDFGIDEAPIDEANHGKGCFEVTTMYLEFPATGPGSLIPQIPTPSTARWGGQAFSGHAYKSGIISDRFGGINLVTVMAPNVKNTFTYVQIEEEWTGAGAVFGTAKESFAIIDSVEFTPQKGLTVKPTFVYDFRDVVDGNISRFTIGADARWREGPYMVEPTFLYQGGTHKTGVTTEADISSWLFDVLGTWRQGPLTLGVRFAYSPGNETTDDPAADGTSNDIDFFTKVSSANTYWSGWTELWAGGVEYQHRVAAPCDPAASISCDEQGLIAFTGKADYALTPALSVTGLIGFRWSAEDLDTDSDGLGPGGTDVGDENFLGTEIAAIMNWRFAPNVRFAASYGHIFAGAAGDKKDLGRDAEDSDRLAAYVRVSF